MIISDAMLASLISDPPKHNRIAEVEVPNERFIVEAFTNIVRTQSILN